MDDDLDYNPETDFYDPDIDDTWDERFDEACRLEEEKDPSLCVMDYRDILSGRKILTDFDYRHKDPNAGHGFTTHANGMMFEVEEKRSEFFRRGSVGSFPWDLIDPKLLLELDSEERLTPYLLDYVDRLKVTLKYQKRGDEWDRIETNLPAVHEFIHQNLNNLRFYIGMGWDFERDGAPVLQYKNKPKTLIYFEFGMYGVINRSEDARWLLKAPLDEPVKRPRELEGLEPELKRPRELESPSSHESSEGSEDSLQGSQDSSSLSLEGGSQSWRTGVLPVPASVCQKMA